jgi:iron complex transport system substrate-binding protein
MPNRLSLCVARWLAALVLQAGCAMAHAHTPQPQRVVSMLPSLTEVVCDLGKCGVLVGVDRWSNWPASVKALPHLGGLDDPQVERIVALKPDLVLMSSASRLAPRLRALGVNVAELDTTDLPGVQRVMQGVADLLGVPQQGRLRWQHLQQRIAQAASTVPVAKPRMRVYVEVSRIPHAAGEASYVGQLLQRLGAGNVVPAALGAFPQLNPEFVVRADPDLIIVAKADVPHVQSRPGWAQMRAVREQRWCALGPAHMDVLARPGPRLADAADVLAECLRRKGAP